MWSSVEALNRPINVLTQLVMTDGKKKQSPKHSCTGERKSKQASSGLRKTVLKDHGHSVLRRTQGRRQSRAHSRRKLEAMLTSGSTSIYSGKTIKTVPGAIGSLQHGTSEEKDVRAARGFRVHVLGRVESAQMTDVDEISCSYEIVTGPDWQFQYGEEASETQAAQNQVVDENTPSVTWNYPIEACFQTTNAAGWPRIAICVRDSNRNIIGYSAARVPTQEGTVVRYCKLFAPLTSSTLGDAIASLTSEPAEFYDSKFSTACPGREAVRVISSGVVKVILMVSIRGHKELGYI